MQDFEKLGVFYLGCEYDLAHRQKLDRPLLYDAKDLTTHAVCVGMTGSGKTGLCLALIEEAAIDGVPVIAIDPKGDLGNLFLTFPELRPEDFRPWIDEGAASRAGVTPDEYAAKTATQWRDGLAAWGQTPDRIARFQDAVDRTIYTPGSSAGVELTVLRSFDAPPQAVLDDEDALRTRINSAASGLLGLLGVDADPVQSREHILLANILDQAWRQGKGLDIASLIQQVQKPPFDKVGVFDLDTFFPAKERLALSMTMNNLLASPSFSAWLRGEPLDVQRLLYTTEGKPRLSVISISHLSDAERMFFVTLLLNEILAWVRTQSGTSSLRAILYMDEVYGYFPPTANPPSKTPMLTLLKQARAFGLGIVLATQNPVDLDYKGLSNTGTWFLGRLQTERDKLRVLEGLEGASAQAGAKFDRQQMEATLAALGNRVFLMNNVHDDEPVVFQSRWALSYLRGPLTGDQIKRVVPRPAPRADSEPAPRPGAVASVRTDEPVPRGVAPAREPSTREPSVREPSRSSSPGRIDAASGSGAPLVPPDVLVRYARPARDVRPGDDVRYLPRLLGEAKLRFVRASYQVDAWQDRALWVEVGAELPDSVWEQATPAPLEALDLEEWQEEGIGHGPFPAVLSSPKIYPKLASQLKDHLYQTVELEIWKCAAPKLFSSAQETEGDFRVRLRQSLREERDRQVEKLRASFRSREQTLRNQIRDAEDRVRREQAEYDRERTSTMVDIGASILGAVLGRRGRGSSVSTTARRAGRAAKERTDVGRAEDRLRDLQLAMADLEAEFQAQADKLELSLDPNLLELERLTVRPKKSDMEVRPVGIIWTPCRQDSRGVWRPAYDERR